MTTIKVNNQVITIANKSTESFDLDKESKALESLALNISKSVEALNIVSNIKAMESFGYKSTEGVGEKIKAGAKVVWEKIKQFFIKIGRWCKNIITTVISAISNKIRALKQKKVDKVYEKKIQETIIPICKKYPYGCQLIKQSLSGSDVNTPVRTLNWLSDVIKHISTASEDDILRIFEESKNVSKEISDLKRIIDSDNEWVGGAIVGCIINKDDFLNKSSDTLKKLIILLNETSNIVLTGLETMRSEANNRGLNETNGTRLFTKMVEITNTTTTIVTQAISLINESTSALDKVLKNQTQVQSQSTNYKHVSEQMKQAVNEKNIVEVRDKLWSRIALDPNFSKGHFDENLKYCHEHGISDNNIFEKHDNRPMSDEISNDNFSNLCGQLCTNFSKERLEKIKEIGKKLYP